ncbi:MAG: type III pantothenate kinase [Candidatus Kapabacteria bacterium]|nr:type III pantothenate kinase [Ignavibacteriota bacterium]MCW5883972.1 type III pantothenate kinase [Candidatus Kapabacteria bacterium]
MDTKNSILFADIGNSRIKLFKNGVKTPFHYKHTGFALSLSDYLSHESFDRVVYSSVNYNAENIFTTIVRNKKVYDFVNIKDLIKEQNIVDIRDIIGIGNDRLLGIVGATVFDEPPIITVDCGTAVTVNVLDYKYKVLGGAIFAGAYTQKNTLASISEKLGFPKFDFNPKGAGANTPSALSLGIIIGVAGAIRMIIENIIEFDHLENPSIFITGGYGGKIQKYVVKHFPGAVYDENLIFRGMAKIYDNVMSNS